MIESTRAVWQLLAGARLEFAMAIVSMVVASILLYLAPLIPQAVIDGVLARGVDPPSALVSWVLAALGGPELVEHNLWLPALVTIFLTGLAGVATYLRGRWSALAAEGVIRRLRDRVYDHLQRLSVPSFDEAESGDLLQRCTSDVETVRVFLANHVVEIGRALVMFFVPLPLMMAIDPRMTLISVVLIPLIVVFSIVFFVSMRAAFKRKDEAESAMTTRVQENLTGIRVVRAFARQEYEMARFAAKNQEHRELGHQLYWLMAVFWSLSDALTFAQQALVVGMGIVWVSSGDLAVGAFFYFLTAVSMFVYPLRQMGRIVADLGKATVALGRLREVLDTPVEPAGGDVVNIAGRVEFQSVSFGYADGTKALSDVSFVVPARSTTAFVGASGSGKSTLIALLLRFYDPDSGTIRIDGADHLGLDRHRLREQVAVVMQQPFLFSKTLEQNLKLGWAGAQIDDVVAATATAQVHDTITGMEDGYATSVGERGVTLSGGQRQRLALARALLQRSGVLILDDALSAVDTRTEAAILAGLAGRRGRQTTILVAHRLSTVVLADEIHVLDAGSIVQSGTHEELVRADGPYARMWALQTEDNHATRVSA